LALSIKISQLFVDFMGNSASKGGMSFTKKETDEIKEALAGHYAEAVARILLLKKVFPDNRMA
jgi:hypothetical protein